MAIVIDANMRLFAERLNISSSRMIQDYGLSTVEEIIEAEAERGNNKAIRAAQEYYHSPDKLIKYFGLADVENRFVLLHKMDDETRAKLLPKLSQEDLVMGLYFFTQEKLLKMLEQVDIQEIVNVVLEAFPLEQIVLMMSEEDLAGFFMNQDLDKKDVMDQLKCMPADAMQKFIENLTGMPSDKTNIEDLFRTIDQLPDDKFHKFMASIDPDTQRQVVFQLAETDPKNLQFVNQEAYVEMMSTLVKPDMVKPMIMLNKETLVDMIEELPSDLMSIVAAQIDVKDFATFLQDGHMDLIEEALMI